jgi:hypothetical protein
MSIWLGARGGDELDTGGGHPVIGLNKVIHAQEEANTTTCLASNNGSLVVSIRLSEQYPCLTSGGSTTTHRFGRPSLVNDGESSANSKPTFSTKNAIAGS